MLTLTTTFADRRILGIWGVGSNYGMHTIYVEKSERYLVRAFSDGSSTTNKIVKDTKGTKGTVYRNPDDPQGDYWIVRHPNLEIWDAMGKVATLKPNLR